MLFASLQNLFANAPLLAPFLSLVAVLLALGCLFYALSLHARFKRLALGRNGSIEESVSVLSRDLKEMKKFRTELESYLKLVETRLAGSVQGVGIVRFNPFSGDGSGGNQSFAAAFLDEAGNGVVFSSLYARDRVGLYAKPLAKGVSTHELTGEEKEAITKAQASVKAHKKPQP
jgi:hypothetical protein